MTSRYLNQPLVLKPMPAYLMAAMPKKPYKPRWQMEEKGYGIVDHPLDNLDPPDLIISQSNWNTNETKQKLANNGDHYSEMVKSVSGRDDQKSSPVDNFMNLHRRSSLKKKLTKSKWKLAQKLRGNNRNNN